MLDIVLNDMIHAWIKWQNGNGSNGSSSWIKKIVQIMLLNTATETKQIVKCFQILTENNSHWLLIQALKWSARYGTNRMIKTAFNILETGNNFEGVVKV